MAADTTRGRSNTRHTSAKVWRRGERGERVMCDAVENMTVRDETINNREECIGMVKFRI